MVEISGVTAWFVLACLVGIALSLLMTFTRLLKGPVLADRVVALDLVSYQSIALMLVYAVYMGQPGFLDVALVLALVAFFGTVAFAGYIEHASKSKEEG
jgi:multicomponent Na+:H+ antiporter subunit F